MKMAGDISGSKYVAQPTKVYMGVSKNRVTPKWLVSNGTPY